MNIYIDTGKTVKTYRVKPKIAKAVMTLIEADEALVWSETREGYSVKVVDKMKSGGEE